MGREPSKKIFLPSSRQARPPSPVHLRRRGMPACPAYPVIRNNAAPFLFRTIPIPSVHDAGWHVRVYEASSTVKKKVPRRLREHAHELWRTAASGYEQWQLINYINLYNNPTSVRPLQWHLIFSPSPRQRNLPEVGKNGNHQERDSTMPGKITPSHSFRYRKSTGSREPAPVQRLDNLHDRPSFAYISSSAQVTMSTLRSKKDYSILS